MSKCTVITKVACMCHFPVYRPHFSSPVFVILYGKHATKAGEEGAYHPLSYLLSFGYRALSGLQRQYVVSLINPLTENNMPVFKPVAYED